jgi:hypothetical protein
MASLCPDPRPNHLAAPARPKVFSAGEAEAWWAANRSAVLERYGLLPSRARDTFEVLASDGDGGGGGGASSEGSGAAAGAADAVSAPEAGLERLAEQLRQLREQQQQQQEQQQQQQAGGSRQGNGGVSARQQAQGQEGAASEGGKDCRALAVRSPPRLRAIRAGRRVSAGDAASDHFG